MCARLPCPVRRCKVDPTCRAFNASNPNSAYLYCSATLTASDCMGEQPPHAHMYTCMPCPRRGQGQGTEDTQRAPHAPDCRAAAAEAVRLMAGRIGAADAAKTWHRWCIAASVPVSAWRASARPVTISRASRRGASALGEGRRPLCACPDHLLACHLPGTRHYLPDGLTAWLRPVRVHAP